tara:strand:- start:378 stop:563 length:186 start_codon:yes stop_codon:yes gene_type:complete
MPKLSGEDALTAMIACNSQAHIVIFSGQEMDKTTLNGASAFLPKPIVQHQLLQTVRDVLDG